MLASAEAMTSSSALTISAPPPVHGGLTEVVRL